MYMHVCVFVSLYNLYVCARRDTWKRWTYKKNQNTKTKKKLKEVHEATSYFIPHVHRSLVCLRVCTDVEKNEANTEFCLQGQFHF